MTVDVRFKNSHLGPLSPDGDFLVFSDPFGPSPYSNVACASCLFLFKNHKFHMCQKKDAKTSQNTDVSNVHFLLQITYETHDHWKCDVAFAWEKPMRSTFFQKTHAFLEFWTFFQKNLNKNAIITRSLHHETFFFYNTFAACTGSMKTLLPVDENTHFCACTLGRMKPETRADEGSERCCCYCCCCGWRPTKGQWPTLRPYFRSTWGTRLNLCCQHQWLGCWTWLSSAAVKGSFWPREDATAHNFQNIKHAWIIFQS